MPIDLDVLLYGRYVGEFKGAFCQDVILSKLPSLASDLHACSAQYSSRFSDDVQRHLAGI